MQLQGAFMCLVILAAPVDKKRYEHHGLVSKDLDLAGTCICFESVERKRSRAFSRLFVVQTRLLMRLCIDLGHCRFNNNKNNMTSALEPYHHTTEQLQSSGWETLRFILSAQIKIKQLTHIHQNPNNPTQTINQLLKTLITQQGK